MHFQNNYSGKAGPGGRRETRKCDTHIGRFLERFYNEDLAPAPSLLLPFLSIKCILKNKIDHYNY